MHTGNLLKFQRGQKLSIRDDMRNILGIWMCTWCIISICLVVVFERLIIHDNVVDFMPNGVRHLCISFVLNFVHVPVYKQDVVDVMWVSRWKSLDKSSHYIHPLAGYIQRDILWPFLLTMFRIRTHCVAATHATIIIHV